MSDTRESATAGLSIGGEFTIFTAMEIKTHLLEGIDHSATQEIEVDLSEVSEIDSAGLQLMVMAKRHASGQGKTLRFCRHSDPVLDLLDLCDLAGFFGDPVLIRSRQQG